MCIFLHAHQGALRRHVAEVNEVPTNHAATAWKPLLTARVEAPVFHYTIALTIATLVRVVRSPGRRRRHLEYEVGRSALSVYQLAVAAAHRPSGPVSARRPPRAGWAPLEHRSRP